MSYSKLHASVVNSSLWTEPDHVRILFITLLAMCDQEGIVYGSRLGITRLANIGRDNSDDAWKTLLSPDPESGDRMRAPENDGRRIEEVPGGFRLLNFAYYRGIRNEDDRREQNRKAQERFKAKVSQGKPIESALSRDNPPKAHTEAEAEAEAEAKNKRRANFVPPHLEEVKAYAVERGLPGSDGESFFDGKQANGWKNGSSKMVCWKSAFRVWQSNGWHTSQKKSSNETYQRPHKQTPSEVRNSTIIGASSAASDARATVDRRRKAFDEECARDAARRAVATKVAEHGGSPS